MQLHKVTEDNRFGRGGIVSLTKVPHGSALDNQRECTVIDIAQLVHFFPANRVSVTRPITVTRTLGLFQDTAGPIEVVMNEAAT